MTVSAAESTGRRIEEVVVTAEKRESTVSDTSISITAFDSEMIENLGLQSADELVNFIPATTRDAYDIRIRGVGRNFRALGGDPGVATYYNGIYSPDFGIAASENALYDLERVEVLRGPQGTLYGRNSIGGALNYVTKRPTMDVEGELRAQVGAFNTREFYGVLSGPIVTDRLAARFVGVKRDRDGSQDSLSESPDTDSADDRNLALGLLWQVTDDIQWYARVNDRKSDRVIPGRVYLDHGTSANRSADIDELEVLGLRPLSQYESPTDSGVLSFTDPRDGSTVYGAYRRAGVDARGFPYMPNSFYGVDPNLRPAGIDPKDPLNETAVNDDGVKCKNFPYDTCNANHEIFEHKSLQSDITWDINDNLALTYLFGYTDFEYTFNQDLDDTPVDFTKYRQTVLEDVWNYSHELQLNWAVGEKLTGTSGAFYYKEERAQIYSLSNTTPRFTEGVSDYGRLDDPLPILGGLSVLDLYCLSSRSGCAQVGLYSSEVGNSDYGLYQNGDPRGDPYSQDNTVQNEQIALYTQATYQFNDNWALVLGIRYAEDKKSAQEIRGGYAEGDLNFVKNLAVDADGNPTTCAVAPAGCYGPLAWIQMIGFAPDGSLYGGVPGLTDLAATNIAMGNATATFDPVSPISPNCAIDDVSCATPLRLSGIPISYSSWVEGNDKWSDTNFRINLDWTPTEDILMYFSFTTGYRAGGYQLGVADARDQPRDPETGQPISGGSFEPLTYDKETVESFEIGYKGLHFDGTLQLNASIYQYQYDGYQDRLNVFDPVRNRGVDIVQNADGVINRGFEVETLWLATERLTLGGNYSFTDAFYDEDYFVIDTENPALPTSLFGTPTTAPELFVINVKGDQLKRIPEHKATIWGSYDIPTSFGNFSLRADYSYTGDYQASGITRDLDKVPARHRGNVAIIWEDLQRRWTIRGFVDNVTDENNLRGVTAGGETTNYRLTGSHLYPRYWGLDVTYRFGG